MDGGGALTFEKQQHSQKKKKNKDTSTNREMVQSRN